MAWRRRSTRATAQDRHGPPWRRRAGSSRRARLVGWLVAIAILLQGWLPVLLQASLLAAEASAHVDSQAQHAHHAGAPAQNVPEPAPVGKGPECPVLHSAVCLCAVLVKVLPPPAVGAVLAPATTRRARDRLPSGKLRRKDYAASFEARAPPFSD
jgi:hypothetical protein